MFPETSENTEICFKKVIFTDMKIKEMMIESVVIPLPYPPKISWQEHPWAIPCCLWCKVGRMKYCMWNIPVLFSTLFWAASRRDFLPATSSWNCISSQQIYLWRLSKVFNLLQNLHPNVDANYFLSQCDLWFEHDYSDICMRVQKDEQPSILHYHQYKKIMPRWLSALNYP